ncbi:CAP domain-containing protein [Sphaerisporangium corydalis]|uniref:CAP domain-containing protein n=1 Tax=Sphaerisporangium corydalis TaxID=1441875 RepID=A0ABV9EMW8_9ACTN|nr:CAP domain-containing protein [Sphaerisporangium corydalis]
MGLLACLTAILLGGIIVSRLDTSKAADEIYLQTGTPTPATRHLIAAPEQPSGTRRPALGHVSRPAVRPSGEPKPAVTATTPAKKSNSIDGFDTRVPPAGDVGTASGGGEDAPPADAPPAGELEATAVDLTNRERMRKGCDPLRVDPRLARAARAHSRDMAARNYFGHTSPGGQSPWDRMARAGYSNSAAENIARGYESADEAVRGWMANSGHRRNILNCQITTVGIGVAYGSGDTWWTQDFGYS